MEPILQVQDLSLHFPVFGGLLKKKIGAIQAVSHVNFQIKPGETLGIVGESGCGKTTLGRMLVRLLEPTGGSIHFQGQDLMQLKPKALKQARRNIQMVFQDPYASLNPRMTVGELIEEPLHLHSIGTPKERQERAALLIDLVGMKQEALFRFPHELSGGQRQRVCIARSLALEPKLIIADEPVSALDVSIQSQVLNLMKELQEKLSLTYVFISHDLAVVRHIADRIAVMYLGRIVEIGSTESIFAHPSHPYTKALLKSVPIHHPSQRLGIKRELLKGDIPSPRNPPKGCSFHTRCPVFESFSLDHQNSYPCQNQIPALQKVSSTEMHQVACHHAHSF